MAKLENKWHVLPSGGKIKVLNGNGQVIVASTLIDPVTGLLPALDAVIFKEAADLLGYEVEPTDQWKSDTSGTFRTVTIQRKVRLDEPEQV